MLPVYRIVLQNNPERGMNDEPLNTRREVVEAYWSPIQAFHSWLRKNPQTG
jgi:hypothetical protein